MEYPIRILRSELNSLKNRNNYYKVILKDNKASDYEMAESMKILIKNNLRIKQLYSAINKLSKTI